METKDYIFKKITDKSIVVFSKFYIPYDSKGYTKAFKDGLKNALNNLEKAINEKGDYFLTAKYGATSKYLFESDTENLLFYNIGTKIFKRFSSLGISFERIDKNEVLSLQKQYAVGEEFSHYYEYTLSKGQTPKYLKSEIACFENIELKCTGLTPYSCFKAFKENADKIIVHDKIDCDKNERFAIILDLQKDKRAKFFNITTVIKPLLDGLICAFQGWSFNENDLSLLAQKFGCEKELFTRNQSIALQYDKQFVKRYDKMTIWYPADHLCDYAFISVKEGEKWNLNGKIVKL